MTVQEMVFGPKILILTMVCVLLRPAAIAIAGTAGAPTTTTPTTGPVEDPGLVDPFTDTKSTASGPSDLINLSLEDLMNVEVTSVSKKKESIADAPAAVTVIDQDDIARSGFTTIPDMLRLVPGMDVARINSYSWAVSTRGLNSQFANKLLVLQDGRSVYSPLTAGVFWETVDYVLQDLDRIEVIRGPGATLWGSNAVNGVINITSKDARDTQGWLVSGLGSNDNSDLAARYGGKLSDDTFYRVYFKGENEQGFPEASKASLAGDESDREYSGRGGFRIDKHASDNDTFTFQGDLANNQLRVPMELPTATPPYGENQIVNGQDITGNVLGRWNHRVDGSSDFSLQLYYDYLKYVRGNEDADTNTLDIDFNDRFTIGTRNEVSWGAGYRIYRTHVESSNAVSAVPPGQIRNLFSIFLQDQVAIVPDRFFLTLGSKLEHNDFTGFEVDPSARLLWTPDKRNSVWVAVSQAIRSPSTLDTEARATVARFAVPTGNGGTLPGAATISGDPDFVSEKLIAYELGYRVQASKLVSIDVSSFYNNYTKLQSVVTGPAQPGATVIIPSTFANGIDGSTYGCEIAGNMQVTERWRLAASYSLLLADFKPASGFTDAATARDYEGSAPQNQVQLHSYLDITKRLHLNASEYFTDRVTEFNVPAFLSTDLSLMWEPRDGMEVTVGATNLFAARHPEYGTTLGQGFADEVPRTVYAQISYSF